jgi:hypothetical protein
MSAIQPVDLGRFESVLADVEPASRATERADRPIENTAFYDFSFYEFLFPTETGGYRGVLSDMALATLDDFQTRVGAELASLLLDVLARMELVVRENVKRLKRADWDEDQVALDLLGDLYRLRDPILPDVLQAYYAEMLSGIGRHFLDFLADRVAAYLRARIYPWYPSFYGFWSGWPAHFTSQYGAWHTDANAPLGPDGADGEEVPTQAKFWRDEDKGGDPDQYAFEVFAPGSVNLGLRLIYRQHWRQLGTQPGEIVRTIPLGPGQTERVTVKVVRRRKTTTNMETTSAVETETETTDSTKDSSEVVTEAVRSSNWNVATEVSGGIGFVSAKVNASVGGASEDRSRQTSSALSESMRKTASKIRRETKVTVATESEESIETERFSEIRNTNNETAVTYEFLKLQHQYEVFTHLAELQFVLYVAEQLPSTIDEEWVRRYDWIIARVLKDESHRATLNELIQDVDQETQLDTAGKLGLLADKAVQNFAAFNPNTGTGGLTVPDIYSAPGRIYQEELRAVEERRRANQLRTVRRERLFQHIRENILYYQQAIWLAEDSDQRLLRYKKEGRRLPIEWRGPLVLQRTGASGPPGDLADYSPTGREAELWEVIDPTGPVAYIGNYAVFTLKPLPDHYRASISHPADERDLAAAVQQGELLIGLNEVLTLMATPYMDGQRRLRDPARNLFDRLAGQQTLAELRQLSDEEVYDLVSYLPRLRRELLDDQGNVRRNGQLHHQVTHEDWAEFLYRKNNTRRFLVDSNNLYLDIRASGGAALEPFKRAHRYLDVLRAAEEVNAERWKNVRRGSMTASDRAFDPDIDKVVVVADGAGAAGGAAITHALGDTEAVSAPVPTPDGGPDGGPA